MKIYTAGNRNGNSFTRVEGNGNPKVFTVDLYFKHKITKVTENGAVR